MSERSNFNNMNHIEISGTSYPISFGYGALMEYETMTGGSAISLFSRVQGGNVGITELITLLACGLQNGADETGDPRPFTPKAVARMLDKELNVEGIFAETMKYLENSFAKDTSAKKKTVNIQANRAARRKAS